ncbi:uncharacterized protein LOC142574053 [Dermacentor variabilis]|uniref:uncharacterized protein LOC142574053 n=1 Tax=Dermacentor variabilis TaxID=34621 RepID=UPI003F5C71BB
MPSLGVPLFRFLLVLTAAAFVGGAGNEVGAHSAHGADEALEALLGGHGASFPIWKIFGIEQPRRKGVEVSSFKVHVDTSVSSKRPKKRARTDSGAPERKHRKGTRARRPPYVVVESTSNGEVLGKSLLRNHFFHDLFKLQGAPAGENISAVGPQYVVNNGVGQKKKSLNPLIVIVRRRSARNESERAAESAAASRLLGAKGGELHVLGGHESRNEMESRQRVAAEAAINVIKKVILKKMLSSSRSVGDRSKPCKNGSALTAAIISPALLFSRTQHFPPVFSEESSKGGYRVAAPVLPKIEVSYEFQEVKYEGGIESGAGSAADLLFPASPYDRRPPDATAVYGAVLAISMLALPITIMGLLRVLSRYPRATTGTKKTIFRLPCEAPAYAPEPEPNTKDLNITGSLLEDPISITVNSYYPGTARPALMQPPKQTTV